MNSDFENKKLNELTVTDLRKIISEVIEEKLSQGILPLQEIKQVPIYKGTWLKGYGDTDV